MQPSGPRCIVHVPRRFIAEEWGGTETVILEIARRQQRAGLEPRILTSMALARQRTEEIGGIPVERFPYFYPFFGLTAADRAAMDKKGGNLVSFSLLHRLLRLSDVRLFHAHALKRLGGEIRTAARLRRKPYVVSLHGGVFDVPPAELASMAEPIAGRFEWGRFLGALFGSRRLLDEADHVICVGQSELEKARQALPHDRVSYLPNGVDTARFAQADGAGFRARHGLAPDAFVVLNAGRIAAQKNQHLLVEAFARVLAERPGSVLLLMGPETDPDYGARVRAAAEPLGGAVRLLGSVRNDDPDLVAAFHAADLFALPSRHEPFGIVVLEAWSAGLPVVVSSVGGLRALVRQDETGLFFDPEGESAAERLAERILFAAARPELRRRLGAAGLAEARAQYDWDRIHDRLEGIYARAEAHAASRGRPS
ncbi:MAG: glycosyltransferase family 4 protein [Verrucomicrobia bacterium]|nr:glycosyltransferase family 4 protein [Verrucomicrobiota bacterium]